MRLLGLPGALRAFGGAIAGWLRPRRVGPRVAGRIRDHVGHGDAERVVDAVRHLVARDELPAGGVSRDDDRTKIRKYVLVRELLQNLIDEIE